MHDSNSLSFKQLFLKQFLMGLKILGPSSQNMSCLERKKAIKLSADVAMACARDESNLSSGKNKNKTHVRNSMGKVLRRLKKPCKRVMRRSSTTCRIRKSAPQSVLASSIAKRIVKKRTQVLKNLIPGGDLMDELSLLEETADYILSLRAQVEVMGSLAKAFELPHCN